MDVQIISYSRSEQLSLVQFSTPDKNSVRYISGAQAIAEKKLEVREISESGSVNNLAVLNFSGEFVFFSDGDMLIGAKQNRVINTSILLFSDSKTVIPVSCVEAGRWNFRSKSFTPSKFHAPSSMRSEKARDISENLKKKAGFFANQRGIWDKVSSLESELKCSSSTSNFEESFFFIEDKADKLAKSFLLDDETNGIAFFRGGDLISIDVFNRTDICKNYFERIAGGCAMEIARYKSSGSEEKPSDDKMAEVKYKTLDFMDNYEKLNFEENKSVSAGIDKRFETNLFRGFELNFQEHLIHMTAFSK